MYLSRSNRAGCEAVLQAGDGSERRIYVQDLQKPLPDWLTGTPLCVHAGETELHVYAGEACVSFLASRRRAMDDLQQSDQVEPKIDQSMIDREMERRGLG